MNEWPGAPEDGSPFWGGYGPDVCLQSATCAWGICKSIVDMRISSVIPVEYIAKSILTALNEDVGDEILNHPSASLKKKRSFGRVPSSPSLSPRQNSEVSEKQSANLASQGLHGVAGGTVHNGVIGKLLAARNVGCNMTGMAILGILAEVSIPGSGGLSGPHRRRLLKAGFFSQLVDITLNWQDETHGEELEEVVACILMYLSTEISFSLTLGDGYKPDAFEKSLDVLQKLMRASSISCVTYACAAVWALGRCGSLSEPLGEAGVICSGVDVVRRWYDLDERDRKENKPLVEWSLAALVVLIAHPDNLRRFCESWKVDTEEGKALTAIRDFGYKMRAPGAPNRTSTAPSTPLLDGAAWNGCGRSEREDARPARIKQTLNSSPEFFRPTLKRTAEAKFSSHRGARHNSQRSAGTNVERDKGQNLAIQSKEKDSEDKIQEMLRSYKAGKSAADPIGLMVQIIALKTRQISVYVRAKLLAVRILRHLSKVKQYRQRMIDEGAGGELSAVACDPQYDPKTRAAAARLWFDVSLSEEGHHPSWWEDAFPAGKTGTDLSWPVDKESLWFRAQVLMQAELGLKTRAALSETEPLDDQQAEYLAQRLLSKGKFEVLNRKYDESKVLSVGSGATLETTTSRAPCGTTCASSKSGMTPRSRASEIDGSEEFDQASEDNSVTSDHEESEAIFLKDLNTKLRKPLKKIWSGLHIDRHDGPAKIITDIPDCVSRWSPNIAKTSVSEGFSGALSQDLKKEGVGMEVVLHLDPPRRENVVTFQLPKKDKKPGDNNSTSKIGFGSSIPSALNSPNIDSRRDFQFPQIAMWISNTRARASSPTSPFPKYDLQDGIQAHFYCGRKTRVDEISLGPDDDDTDRGTLKEVHQQALPTIQKGWDVPKAPILRKLVDLPSASRIPEIEPPKPVYPDELFLQGMDWEKGKFCRVSSKRIHCFPKVASTLSKSAPLGNEIVVRKEEAILAMEDIVVEKVAGEPWDIESSIFKPRKSQCDSKAFYDNDDTLQSMFEKDWEYCMQKEKFKRFIGGKSRDNESGVLKDVKLAMGEFYPTLIRMFDYQSCLSSGSDIFSMHLNEWGQLMVDCGIPDELSTTCKLSHLDTIFISTNFEEDKTSDLSGANVDDALMRFEFVEAIVRVARLKFIDSQTNPEMRAVSDADAIRKLHKTMESKVCWGAKFEVKHQTPYRSMQIENWMKLLSDSGLLHPYFTFREARIAFVWSRMHMIDDMIDRQKARGLSFVDFLECLARSADLISPPPPEVLQANGFNSRKPTAEYFRVMSETGAILPDRPSADITKEKTRPLEQKLLQIVEVLVTNLLEKFKIRKEADLVEKLNPGGLKSKKR
ncbi:hypothetical protein BSKO_01196 [Bryopsis sp. KO-2023]|nr:hypothetical protein BSKO_01196 [Bryopsis sp. KO-2023]